jgi:hypothetical protein
MPDAPPKEFEFQVDGKPVDLEDLTFEELHDYRKHVRELAEDPTLELAFADGMDRWPVLVWIVRRRADESYTLDDAIKSLKPKDVLVEKRPTRARSTRKT